MTVETDVLVRDNPDGSRYELLVDGDVVGALHYRLRRDRVSLVHTEVQPAFEGRGLAGRLVAGALEDIRARKLRVVPICPYARAYIQRHPEYADVVAK